MTPSVSTNEGRADPPTVFGRPVDDLSDVECLRLDDRIAEEPARLEAWRLRVRARFARLRPPLAGDREGGKRGFSEFAGDEVAALARLAPASAGRQLELAVAVVNRLPGTLAALEAGEIDLDRARAMADVTKSLDDGLAGTVENRVLAHGARPSWRRIVTDPVDGAVLDVGSRRHPSPAMARFVRARDRTCVFPGS